MLRQYWNAVISQDTGPDGGTKIVGRPYYDDVITSDFSERPIDVGIEVKAFGNWGSQDTPTRHFIGAVEMIEFALTKSPNASIIKERLAKRGLKVCTRCSCSGGECSP